MPSPAFQFYPKDFLADEKVGVMSLAERGAYITLLCVCWNEGTLPADSLRLAKLCGVPLSTFRKLWPAVELCFRPCADTPDRLCHPRLQREIEKQEKFRRRQSDKGKASGEARRGLKRTTVQPDTNHGSTAVEPSAHEPNRNSAICNLRSSSSDSSREKRAGVFAQWYEDTHQRLLGVGYMGTNRDWETLLRLCEKFTDQQLQDAALVWFGADDDFARNGTRTIPKFASRVSGYLELIKAKGIA